MDGKDWYEYCRSNPLRYVDPDGRAISRWDKMQETFYRWKDTNPQDRYPWAMQYEEAFIWRLWYMQERQHIDLSKLTINELDAQFLKEVYEQDNKYLGYGSMLISAASVTVKTNPTGTSFFEKIIPKKVLVSQLRANPYDEFTTLGPSGTALSKHINYIKKYGTIEEPILVKKIGEGIYEIINGHHRWLAAIKMGLKYVWVKVIE